MASISNAQINKIIRFDMSAFNSNYTVVASINQNLSRNANSVKILNIANNDYMFSGKLDGINPSLKSFI